MTRTVRIAASRRLIVCAAVLLGTCGLVARADPPRQETPDATRPSTAPVDDLRKELADLKTLLKLQQSEIEQQNRRIQQLEGEGPALAPHAAPAEKPLASAGAVAEPATLSSESPCAGETPSLAAPVQAPFHIGGQYRVLFNGSNFEFHPFTLTDTQEARTFAPQRLRPDLTVSPNEHIEGYVQMEIGHVLWGDNFDLPKTYVGPRFPPKDDRVGIELRQGYLTYKSEDIGRVRTGIQAFTDSFGETLFSGDWDFNVGGVSWKWPMKEQEGLNAQVGGFVLAELAADRADDAYLFTADLDWKLTEQTSLGFSAYYLPDNDQYSYPTAAPYASAWDVWLGIRGSTVLGPVPVKGFLIVNTGRRNELGQTPDFEHTGLAMRLELGGVEIGPGKASVQALGSTGGNPASRNNSEFRTVAQSVRDNFGAQGYWSYLVITSPHGPSDVSDLGLSLQNRGLGLYTIQAKYEYPVTHRLSGLLAAGWFGSAERNPTSYARGIGTELAKQFTYDFGGGLKLDLGAAYLFTGDFYKPTPQAPGPNDLWEVFSRLQLDF